MGKRNTVAVDVDGVFHSYTSGWQGADTLPDPPVENVIARMADLVKEFDIAINSTRANSPEGIAAIKAYLLDNGFPQDDMEHLTFWPKPPALVYVDDRAWRFDGTNFPTVEDVRSAYPWWHK